jgi:para-nitrobenzyl esterase
VRTRASDVDEEGGPVVRTTSGLVRGLGTEGGYAFLGVPYAAPPVGPLRFAPPVPPRRWRGVRDATRFGPTAPQSTRTTPLVKPTIIEGDDCLHVNVHTPDLGPARLPVLVWIHGGGMVMGCNADAWIQGARLSARGIVVVSINYRLGVDGFLPLPDAGANRAVLDWRAALAWVQDNVAGFGGDPDRVTIGGQSAGSAACLTLLADARHHQAFRRVVAMSGVPWNLVDLATAEARADELADRVGVDRTAAGLASVPYDRLFEVQTAMAPIGGITGLGDPLTAFHDVAGTRTWLGPVPDGDVVPVPPLDAIAAGTGSEHDLLVGSTHEEMDALIGVFGTNIDRAAAVDALRRVGLTGPAVRRWLDALGDRSPGHALGAALTAMSFGLPVLRVAEARFGAAAPTFVYEVTWHPSTPLGAVHAIDLPYAFDLLDAENVDLFAGGVPPASLADDLSSALVRFVADGDPGWPRYRADERATMAFDLPSTVRHDPARVAREVFASLC